MHGMSFLLQEHCGLIEVLGSKDRGVGYILSYNSYNLHLMCNSSTGVFPGLTLNIDSQQHKYQPLNIHVRNRMTYHLFPIGIIKIELCSDGLESQEMTL